MTFIQATLSNIFVVSTLWGFHIISLAFCMHALFTKKKGSSSKIKWGMVATAWILFSNATLDIALTFDHILHAFISATSFEDAETTLAISSWNTVTRSACVGLQTAIGDAVLIYRCWIVYSYSLLVITPSSALWFAMVGSAIWAIVLEGSLNVLFDAGPVIQAIRTFWSITIVLNIITTSLLAYRIWSIENTNKKHRLEVLDDPGGGTLKSIRNIIIESGLLYTLSAITAFGTYVGGSEYVYLTSGVQLQVVGIAFNLIIIRTTNLSRQTTSTSRIVNSGSRGPQTAHSIPLRFAHVTHEAGQAHSKTEVFNISSVETEVEQPAQSKARIES
ncbi:hypothetical protein BDN70DRAFT_922883 [Pholiota conissans]|uniref:Uncharacterized protein n=1 Tax=Pholiota conissans TaxID=109636 RepID=A0A9P5YWM9_9AGAR|nr:hypothetical protein BDN70DRAFT_922883 [Pholiota conissans]